MEEDLCKVADLLQAIMVTAVFVLQLNGTMGQFTQMGIKDQLPVLHLTVPIHLLREICIILFFRVSFQLTMSGNQ